MLTVFIKKFILVKRSFNFLKRLFSSLILLIILIFQPFFLYADNDFVHTNFSLITPNFMHISLDDVTLTFDDIIVNNYDSLFDNPLLKNLQILHNKYNAVFSLYLQDIEQLKQITKNYKVDFENSSNWLKLGFHCFENNKSYKSSSFAEAKQDYETFINLLLNIGCSEDNIDRIPRLSSYEANLESVQGFSSATLGIQGLLTADDDRNSYYLNTKQNINLKISDIYKDPVTDLTFFSTDLRLDIFNPTFKSNHNYIKPKRDSIYRELQFRINSPSICQAYQDLIIFTHEWECVTVDGEVITSKIRGLEECCKFAKNYGYSFDFPQNRI